MKNQGKMFQTKGKDKSPETKHNEIEFYDLTERVKINFHKDTH